MDSLIFILTIIIKNRKKKKNSIHIQTLLLGNSLYGKIGDRETIALDSISPSNFSISLQQSSTGKTFCAYENKIGKVKNEFSYKKEEKTLKTQLK